MVILYSCRGIYRLNVSHEADMFERGVLIFAANVTTSCNILVLNVYYTDKYTTNTTLNSMPVLRLSNDPQDSAKTDNDQ